MWNLYLLALIPVCAQFFESPSFFSPPSFATYQAHDFDKTPPFFAAPFPQQLSFSSDLPSFSFVPTFPALNNFQQQPLNTFVTTFSFPGEPARPRTIDDNFIMFTSPIDNDPNAMFDDFDDDDEFQFEDDTFIRLAFGGAGVPSYRPKVRRPKNPSPSIALTTPKTLYAKKHYDLRGLSKAPSSDHETGFPITDVPPDRIQKPNPGLPADPQAIAEWEPVQGACLRYPLGVSVQLVKDIASELRVYVFCEQKLQQQATDGFRVAGVNMANIVFLDIPTDTYWIRDYGAWFIRAKERGRTVTRIINVRYKEILTRPNDDRTPALLAVLLNQSTHYSLRTVCQGGNFMTDSLGSAASTTRLSVDNPMTPVEEIKANFSQMLGIRNFFVVEDPGYPTNYIRHVDTWCKFISPDKVLVKRVPPTDPLYDAFESAANLWAARTNVFGEKYTVFRVDGPMDSPYVNHVILNDRVFVPVLSAPSDALALSQIQAAYGPDFRIRPVVAAPGLPWLMSDSLHCRMNSIPVLD